MFLEIGVENIIEEKKIDFLKPEVYEGKSYPLERLTDSEFEILTYYLYENNQEKKNKYNYDKAIYVEGGSDRGKDLVLKKEDKIVGIVQCKHSQIKKKQGKNIVSHELLKILLYMIMYPSEISEYEIKYLLVISSNFSKSGLEYIENLKKNFSEKNVELEDEVNKILDKYSSFKSFFKNAKSETIIEKIILNFKRIKFYYEEEQDILLELSKEKQGIKSMFFNIKTNVEIHEFPEFTGEKDENIIKNKKKDYSSELFYTKLKEIECNEKNLEKAILFFYKKQNIVAHLAEKGIINLKNYLENFERDILQLESSERDCFILEYEKEDLEKKKISYKYYINFLNTIIKHQMKVRKLGEATIDFKCGTIHDLANEEKIKKWYLGDE